MKTFSIIKIIFILILVLFVFYKPEIENFIAYNSSQILNLENNNILQDQLNAVNILLKNQQYDNDLYNFDNDLFKPDFDVKYIYKQQFTEYVKKEIIKILNTNNDFRGVELTIVEEPINFYKMESGYNYYYIFEINLFSPNKAIHLHLKIYLEVVDMLKYLTPNYKYQNILPLPDTNISIKNIKLLNTKKEISYKSILENIPFYNFQFYQQIKNILYLA